MKKVHINQEYRDVFASAGLNSFEDFLNYADGQVVNKNKKRDVLKFSIEYNGVENHFFMKRFFSPHYKDMLFTFLNFGCICSQAECEWNNANLLLDNSIDTYHPVAYGKQMSCGIEKNSFFITAAIDGVCLTDYISENFSSITDDDKQNIIASAGRLARRMHDAKLSMPDLYIWHLFIKQNQPSQDDHQFAVIDLHRMSKNASRDACYRNLAAFIFSLSEKYFDDSYKKLFLDAYMGDDFPHSSDKLIAKVKKRVAILAGRRRRAEY